jgi:regulator of sigma E protease
MRFRVLDITEEVGLIGVHNAYPAPVVSVRGAESLAAQAGLRTFDLVTALDGRPVKRWIDVEASLAAVGAARATEVAYLRPERVDLGFMDLWVNVPGRATLAGDAAGGGPRESGLELASLDVAFAVEGYPGYRAGLRVGDRIVELDGAPISIWAELADRLSLRPGDPHEITVIRGTERATVTLAPERITVDDRYAGRSETFREPGIGVYEILVADDPVPNPNRVVRAGRDAFADTVEIIKFMAVGLARIVQGRVSLQSIGGPLMLWELAGTAGRRGASSFLSVLALISVNLGLLNLLPIPVLDGGHLLILGIEAVRRRSLTLRTREIINIAGLALLVLLMVFALKNDIQRYWDWEQFVRLFR